MTKASYVKAALMGAMVAIASGVFTSCGTTDPITWTLNSGVLTISGKDTMPNYEWEVVSDHVVVNTPWYTQRGDITSVIIEDLKLSKSYPIRGRR
ncbi:hypothetical protein FACS1894199_16530 [Bacteroidia bacterium]|nr:hypothetical protein FACS1894199_16530 [Bacteroidia bacterium]